MGSESHDTSRRTILKGSAIGAGALLGAAALPSAARAATGSKPAVAGGANSFFMKFANSTIPLTSISFGVAHGTSEGRASGKEASPSEFNFTAPTTVASPTVMDFLVLGKVLPAVQITGNDSNDQPYLKIDLKNVAVSSYHFSSGEGGIPTDSGTMSYGKITYSYYPSDPAGGLGTPNSVSWDVRSDKVTHT